MGCSASIWRVFPCQKFSSFFAPKENPDEFGTVFAGEENISHEVNHNSYAETA